MRLSADALNRFGEELGRRLQAPAVIGFSGELGTGKTTLVQAICRGLGARARATSPTYALVHQYETTARPGPAVFHVDCYRLRQPAEARDLGFDDMVRDRAIILIEWPERAGAWAPRLDRHFRLSYGPEPDVRELEEIR
ncbi:MAG: tRNA (adenosine(37)-N6)-threonylcarbamoyltransferase complex ATPase subunit type 1 TsaE [Gemmatimonadales bacterium]